MAFDASPAVQTGSEIRTAIAILILPITLSLWPETIRTLAQVIGDRLPQLQAMRDLQMPGAGTVVACLSLFVLNYVFMGLNLSILVNLFSAGDAPVSIAACIGLGGAAWLIGFVTPGSPGGLGVRESVLVSFLSPSIGPGAAVAATVSFRLVSIIADGVALVVGSFLLVGQVEPNNGLMNKTSAGQDDS